MIQLGAVSVIMCQNESNTKREGETYKLLHIYKIVSKSFQNNEI